MDTYKLLFALLYLIALILILMFRHNEDIIFVVLSATIVLALFMHEVKFIPVIIMTFLFYAVENICVCYGLWKYNTENPMPYTPLWLCLAWMASILFILKMYA